ncbi:MAG: SPOR domain-containing protein [Magnetococcales bacterium]|nr:SPOR domain-containing protein [Magnetococcales bacterium]
MNDPNPGLVRGNTLTGVESPNPVPEVRVREMESMLRVKNGQVAVMGGLMQERSDSNKGGAESGKEQEGSFFGSLFKGKEKEENVVTKTEMVIFLRPVVVSSKRRPNGEPAVAAAGDDAGVLETPIISKITPAMPPPPAAGSERAPEVGRISPAQRPESLRLPGSPLTPAPLHSGSSYLDFTKPGGASVGAVGGGGGNSGGFSITTGSDLLSQVPGLPTPRSTPLPAVLNPLQRDLPTHSNSDPGAAGASGSGGVRGNFYLELGSFTDKAGANELHQRVSKSGLAAFQESAEVSGRVFQRVRCGPYPTLAEAEQAQARVASATGIQAQVASY